MNTYLLENKFNNFYYLTKPQKHYDLENIWVVNSCQNFERVVRRSSKKINGKISCTPVYHI